jgi:alkanesulfonate monooxygenase SsuD/methylene tetrahydromethanopterin reductase-like flavin-dependent oxidoreductase (luciferase family)
VISVSISPPERLLRDDLEARRATFASIADAGLDGVLYADHVSFRGGYGMESLLLLAGLSQLHPALQLTVGVYLLPLRHPVTVARAISTFSELAPGRLVFGVGIGGEDRHEIEVCGIDPRTRGARCDESLQILRPLLRGETVTFRGRFYEMEDCSVLPAPSPPVPILVGGRSDAAIRRTARYGDGWLASWCSARRYVEAVARCDELAAAEGRGEVAWQHTIQLWIGLGAEREQARRHVQEGMESFYRIPFSQFEKYTPYGTPQHVADFFAPYLAAGLRRFNLTPCAASPDEAIELAGEVKRLLAGA